MGVSLSERHGKNGFIVTCEALLEINRPELLCYIFAGRNSIAEDADKTIAHFEMNEMSGTTGIWYYSHLEHDIPKRFPVKLKVQAHHFKADNVVRSGVMSHMRNLAPLPIDDVALIERAMRIGLSSCGANYACGGCEATFARYGVWHALTKDIMKEAG